MNDRVSTYPGRVRLTPVEGQTGVYDMTRADSPTQEGTALNKANLLSDMTASAINTLTGSTPSTPNSALYAITNKISAVITSLLTNTTATAIQTLTGTKPTTADGAFSLLTGELSSVEGGLVQIETGSYAGTGTSGSSNPTTITTSIVPKLLMLHKEDLGIGVGGGDITFIDYAYLTTSYKSYRNGGSSNYTVSVKKSSDGKTLYIYSSDTSAATNQFNATSTTYRYVAIG